MTKLSPDIIPDPHQTLAKDFILSRPRGGGLVWADPGTGKSVIGTELVIHWINEGYQRIFISCPPRLTEDWVQKLARYADIKAFQWDDFVEAGYPAGVIPIVPHTLFQEPGRVKHKKARAPLPQGIILGKVRLPIAKIVEFLRKKRWTKAFTVYVEKFGVRCIDSNPPPPVIRKNRLNELIKWAPQVAIVDEHHRFKSYKSGQTKGLAKLAAQCKLKWRIGMTGTPTTTCDPEQLRPQVLFADPALLRNANGVDNWAKWRGRFCAIEVERYGADLREKVVGVVPKNKPELDMLLAQVAISIKADVLGLEKPRFEPLYYRMSSRAQKMYEQLANTGSLLTKDMEIVTNTPMDKAIRLATLRSGFIKDFEGVIHDVDSELIDTAMDRVADTTLPVMLIYNWTHTGERLLKACQDAKLRTAIIKGGVSAKESLAIEQQFQTGKLDVVIGQWQAISLGLTFTASNQMKCVEPTFLFEAWDQAIKRIDRRGQTRCCFYELFNEPSSLDSQNYDALVQKKDFASMIRNNTVRFA